jgi:peptidoglycan/xylan/chitin deacetylase (PgdA/CDA1 family)
MVRRRECRGGGSLRVLAYHAIDDTRGTGGFEPYAVPPEDFRRQMAALKRARYSFVGADDLLRLISGAAGSPGRAVLITFDDCFTSVLEHALPVLKYHGIPAVAFAVTRRLGGTNDWSRSRGAPQLPLLGSDGLCQLARAGVEIGAHSRTHPALPDLGPTELSDEVAGSCADLKEMDLGPVRLFAYPYGESSEPVRQAVESAGCEAAFTVDPGLVQRDGDPFRIPRIEILREDVGWKFQWKVALAGKLRLRRLAGELIRTT